MSAPEDVQRDRVLAREGMTQEKFEAILARQVPDSVKRQSADFVIDTSKGMDAAKEKVLKLIKTITSGDWVSKRADK